LYSRLDKEITPLDLPLAVPIPASSIAQLPLSHPQLFSPARLLGKRSSQMRLKDKIKQAGAAGYILLWLLGIPLPILLLIFLLRGCT
jgi:hypothetical protein